MSLVILNTSIAPDSFFGHPPQNSAAHGEKMCCASRARYHSSTLGITAIEAGQTTIHLNHRPGLAFGA